MLRAPLTTPHHFLHHVLRSIPIPIPMTTTATMTVPFPQLPLPQLDEPIERYRTFTSHLMMSLMKEVLVLLHLDVTDTGTDTDIAVRSRIRS